jgi:hypothetical protein
MTIVPVSLLSAADLALLGNNFAPRHRPARRVSVAAVNRSLALHGEQVARLLVRDAGQIRQSRKVA